MLKCEPFTYHALNLSKLDSCNLFCSKDPGSQKRSVRGGRLQHHYDFVFTAQCDEIVQAVAIDVAGSYPGSGHGHCDGGCQAESTAPVLHEDIQRGVDLTRT